MSLALDPLMPHRAPMQWIDALIACADTSATATACFKPGDFAVDAGVVLETALVECVAQTIAAAMGYRAQSREGNSDAPLGGMLAAVSNFRIQSRPVPGQVLHIEVRELRRFGAMQMVSGVITCGEELVASGELTLYA